MPCDGLTLDFRLADPSTDGELRIAAHLDYLKIYQYLLHFMFGEDAVINPPDVRMASDETKIRIEGM